MKEEQEQCPVCGGVLFDPWRFGLRQCKDCSLVVARSIWNQQSDASLNEMFFGGAIRSSAWVRAFEARKNRATLRRLDSAKAKSAGRLLEVGVGSGSFLAAARGEGYSVIGCDLSVALCERVEHELQIPMCKGGLKSVPPQESFDVVVMNHVLEHSRDPVGFLREAATRLAPAGLLHIAVPNVACWQARLVGWNSYEPYHHLYFTPNTLTEAVRSAGLFIERIETRDSFSGWFLALVRMVRKPEESESRGSRSSNVPPNVEVLYRIAMVLSGLVTYPVRRLQSLMGKGDEIVAIVRKIEAAPISGSGPS